MVPAMPLPPLPKTNSRAPKNRLKYFLSVHVPLGECPGRPREHERKDRELNRRQSRRTDREVIKVRDRHPISTMMAMWRVPVVSISRTSMAASSPGTIVAWTSSRSSARRFRSSSDETSRTIVNSNGLMTTISPAVAASRSSSRLPPRRAPGDFALNLCKFEVVAPALIPVDEEAALVTPLPAVDIADRPCILENAERASSQGSITARGSAIAAGWPMPSIAIHDPQHRRVVSMRTAGERARGSRPQGRPVREIAGGASGPAPRATPAR